MGNVPVSILIPIRNEAQNLPRCLSAIQWAGEIIVVDSQSTDGSQEIATSYGAAVVQFTLKGVWPKKKNWALEHVAFAYEWVLILDADEVLPAEAQSEIRMVVTDANAPFSGFWINRRFMFMGQWLRHAYYPNWNLRLVKHRLARYEKLTNSATNSGDNEVHEHIIVNGKTGRLQCEMDHYAFPSVEVFVEKHNRYSNWEARVALDTLMWEIHPSLQTSVIGVRRRLKRYSYALPCRPLLRFLYVYIWQLGVLDGLRGYYFARLHGYYELLCVLKMREIENGLVRKREGG